MSDTYDDDTDTDTETNGLERGFRYGRFVVDFTKLSQKVLDEAARRGFTHVLSNEAKSKGGTVITKMIETGELVNDTDSVKAKRDQLEDEYRQAYVDSFYDGTWGTRRGGATGPRLDPLETEYARILAREVKDGLNKHTSIRFDKEAKVWYWFTSDGSKVTRTLEEAMANYESQGNRREVLMAQAQEVVDFKKRQAEARAAAKVAEPADIQF